MSRAFVKEDDQEELPFIPPRAHLPEGETNYVTSFGLASLIEEREKLLHDRSKVDLEDSHERRQTLTLINGKLQLLNERIATAKLINSGKQDADIVLFGARVKLFVEATKSHLEFQIVGVDEADITKNKIAFNSPLAKIVFQKKVSETATLKLQHEDRIFTILEIEYLSNT